jgi:hypothetical protein
MLKNIEKARNHRNARRNHKVNTKDGKYGKLVQEISHTN